MFVCNLVQWDQKDSQRTEAIILLPYFSSCKIILITIKIMGIFTIISNSMILGFGLSFTLSRPQTLGCFTCCYCQLLGNSIFRSPKSPKARQGWCNQQHSKAPPQNSINSGHHHPRPHHCHHHPTPRHCHPPHLHPRSLQHQSIIKISSLVQCFYFSAFGHLVLFCHVHVLQRQQTKGIMMCPPSYIVPFLSFLWFYFNLLSFPISCSGSFFIAPSFLFSVFFFHILGFSETKVFAARGALPSRLKPVDILRKGRAEGGGGGGGGGVWLQEKERTRQTFT